MVVWSSRLSFKRSFPLECTFFDHVEKSCQHKGDEQYHFHETDHAQRLEIHGPWVEKDHFHIEKNKEDGDQEILHGERPARVALLLDPAFKALVLVLTVTLGAEGCRRRQSKAHKANGNEDLHYDRQVIVGGG